MNQRQVYLVSALSALSAACGGSHHAANRAGPALASDSNSGDNNATTVVQQNGITLDSQFPPAHVASTAPAQVVGNLVANANLTAIGPWGAHGSVFFVRNANDTDNAARLTVEESSVHSFEDGTVWVGQGATLPCKASYLLLRYDVRLPGGQQSVHVRLTTVDSGGGELKTAESFGDLYPGQAGSDAAVSPDRNIQTTLMVPAQGASQFRVQFGMNDFNPTQFEPHNTPIAADGSIAEFAHISVIATEDPNAQVPVPTCGPAQ